MRIALLLLAAAVASAQVQITGGATIGVIFPGVRNMGVDCPNITGNGTTDDTAAVQACINALPDGWQLLIPANYKIKLTSTINFHNRTSIRLSAMSGGALGFAVDNNRIFVWAGADHGTMFDQDCSNGLIFENFSMMNLVSPGGGSGIGADIPINVHQSSTCTQITSDNVFDNLQIMGAGNNSAFIGIAFSQGASSVNVEHMTVRNTTIVCSYGQNPPVGEGIQLGSGNSNAQGYTLGHNIISYCSKAEDIKGGGSSSTITRTSFGENAVDVNVSGGCIGCLIENNDSEGNVTPSQFFTGLAEGLRFSGNRIAAMTPPSMQAAIQFSGGTWVLLENETYDSGSYMPFATTGGGPHVSTQGNDWPSTASYLAGVGTFTYGSISMLEQSDGINMISGQGCDGTQLANMGCLAFGSGANPYLSGSQVNKWTAMEGAGDTHVHHFIPYVQASAPSCVTEGDEWINTTTSTSVLNICMSVAGTLTWVAK